MAQTVSNVLGNALAVAMQTPPLGAGDSPVSAESRK
jgi:hypothetical protein